MTNDRRERREGQVGQVGQAVRVATRVGAALFLATQVFAQAPANYQPSRLANGHPDLNGIWQALNEAHYDLEAHVARPAMALRPGPYGPVPAPPVLALGAVGAVPPGLGVVEGGAIPYLPEAAPKRKDNQDALAGARSGNQVLPARRAACDLHAVSVSDLAELRRRSSSRTNTRATRNVYLKDPGPAPVDSWMGQSVGRWDGDTLVIDVTGFNDQTWFDRAGNFHSEALHVVERYTRTAADSMRYEATIEDPKVFSRPWKISMPLYRRLEPNAQLMDFKCVEFVEELLYGRLRKTPLSK